MGTRYWLFGRGRPELAHLLGVNDWTTIFWRSFLRPAALPAYLGFLAAGTVALVVWMLIHHSSAWPHAGLPAGLACWRLS